MASVRPKKSNFEVYSSLLQLFIIMIEISDSQCVAGNDSRSAIFNRCPLDMVNTIGLIGDAVLVRTSAPCAARCMENSECFSFNVKTVAKGMECQLSSESADCSNLVADAGARTYVARYGLEEVVCEEGMAEVAATSPYPYPVVTVTTNGVSTQFLCDSATGNGGWLVFQRRWNGAVNFYRGWDDYKTGFGTLDTEFWIGLETLHQLTSNATYELRVDLEYIGYIRYAHYDSFSVGSEADNYRLSVGAYSGTAGDSLAEQHNGRGFSTTDRDNDEYSIASCAIMFTGPWWHGACLKSNLNGVWGAAGDEGPSWGTFAGSAPMSHTELKIRRVGT